MFKKDLGLLLLILVVGAAVAMINPRFLSPINLSNTANLIGLFGLFSLAQAFVIITGGIELSVGSISALLGVIFIDLIANVGLHWSLAVVVVILIGVLMGAVHGFLITRMKLQPFVVTLCGLLIYRGIARYYTEDATAGFAFGQSFPTLEWLTAGRSFGVPHSMIAFIITAIILAVLLHRSVFGRYLFAVGKNEEAARYSGIRTRRIIVAAYVICCGLTALAAIYIAMYTRSISPASHGNFYELYAIAAAVLGGCSLRGGEGSILGVVLGTILLQVLRTGESAGHPELAEFAVMASPDWRIGRSAAHALRNRSDQKQCRNLGRYPASDKSVARGGGHAPGGGMLLSLTTSKCASVAVIDRQQACGQAENDPSRRGHDASPFAQAVPHSMHIPAQDVYEGVERGRRGMYQFRQPAMQIVAHYRDRPSNEAHVIAARSMCRAGRGPDEREDRLPSGDHRTPTTGKPAPELAMLHPYSRKSPAEGPGVDHLIAMC
jgi:ribose transport system permease protein